MSLPRHCPLLTLAVALALTACDKDEPANRNATPAVARAPDPWFLNPDEHCGFDSTASHADAAELAREFVKRDGQGAFMKPGDAWFSSAVECPGREGTWDEYSVVADAEVGELRMVGDTARVELRYTDLGAADPDGFRPNMRKVVDTLSMKRSRFGWRIIGTVPAPHVTVDVAKKRQNFTRADQWTLDQSLAQARRLQPKR